MSLPVRGVLRRDAQTRKQFFEELSQKVQSMAQVIVMDEYISNTFLTFRAKHP
jgi:hypothetical protein